MMGRLGLEGMTAFEQVNVARKEALGASLGGSTVTEEQKEAPL